MAERLEIINKARVKTSYVTQCVAEVDRLVGLPEAGVKIFFLDSTNDCPYTVKDLTGKARETLLRFCRDEKTSMSLTYKGHEHILIFISRNEQYLKWNKTAMIGTIMHELMHTFQRHKGLDKDIESDLDIELRKFRKKIHKLPYKRSDLHYLFNRIGEAAAFAVKDIYANDELISKGLGGYILEDYNNLYKPCIRPEFFKDFKKAAHENIEDAREAIIFELNMMSALVPFSRWNTPKARRLVKHIWRCYEYHLWEVDEAMAPVFKYAITEFNWSSRFRKNFYKRLFDAVYGLLA